MVPKRLAPAVLTQINSTCSRAAMRRQGHCGLEFMRLSTIRVLTEQVTGMELSGNVRERAVTIADCRTKLFRHARRWGADFGNDEGQRD
jgi:hypothetical protein